MENQIIELVKGQARIEQKVDDLIESIKGSENTIGLATRVSNLEAAHQRQKGFIAAAGIIGGGLWSFITYVLKIKQ